MGKRSASSGAAIAAAAKVKVAKMATEVNPIEQKCEQVAASLRKLPWLPEEAAGLLCDVIPFSLALCKEERHAYQQSVVNGMETELLRQEAALERAVDEAQGRVEQLDKDKEVQQSDLDELNAKLTVRKDEAHEKKMVLADAALAFRCGKEALAEAESKQTAGDKVLHKMTQKHEGLGQVISELLEPLKEGTLDKEKVPQASATLIPTLQCYFDVEASLMPAIPTVLSKEPSERGPFDTMAAVELEEQAKKALADFAVAIKDGECGKAERAAAVAQAEEVLNAARVAQLGMADAFAAARAEEEAAEAAVIDAKRAIGAMGPERKARAKAVVKAHDVLKVFREGPLAAFKELCDRSKRPAEAPTEVEAVPEEAATEDANVEMTPEPAAAMHA